jgi:RimJ/RimL family protein N-acetyltransferase
MDGVGFDYIEASTDTENWASRRVLEKCGFVLCETHSQGYNNPVLGLRDTAIYRIARPGRSLEELGLLESGEGRQDTQLVPPIQ